MGPFSESSTSGSTAQNFNFIDEKFEVIPTPAKLNQASEEKGTEAPGATTLPAQDDYTEEDLMFLTENITSMPSIFFDKIPLRTNAQLVPFNHQFYKYCKKKNINPFEYFFDEFGLAMAGLGLAGGIYRDYKENYGAKAKKESKEEKKLSSDYDRAKEIAEQKEKDIQDGKVTGAQP